MTEPEKTLNTSHLFPVFLPNIEDLAEKFKYRKSHVLPEVEEKSLINFNTHFCSMQSWFIHVSCQEKLKFLIKLVRSFLKFNNGNVLLEFLVPTKDFIYSKTQFNYSLNDNTPLDKYQTMDDLTLEAENRSFFWFNTLEDKQQIIILITLVQIAGSSFAYAVYNEVMKYSLEKTVERTKNMETQVKSASSRNEKSFLDKRVSQSAALSSRRVSKLGKKEVEWQAMYSNLLSQAQDTNKHKKHDNLDLTYLDLLPIEVNRSIYTLLNNKSKGNLKNINKYWTAMGNSIQKEELTRNTLNKAINKSQIQAIGFKGKSWAVIYPKSHPFSPRKSMSLAQLHIDVPDRNIGSVASRSSSDIYLAPSSFSLKMRTGFEVQLKRKPTVKYPYIGKYSITNLFDRYDHDRVMAVNKQCIAVSDECNISLHTYLTGAPFIGQLEGHTGCVTALCFHPSKSQLFSGSYDTTVRYWDVYSRSLLKTFYGHTSIITSIAVNEFFLCSASMDRTIKVYDLENGAILWSYECTSFPTVLSIDNRNGLYAGSYAGHIERIILSYSTNEFKICSRFSMSMDKNSEYTTNYMETIKYNKTSRIKEYEQHEKTQQKEQEHSTQIGFELDEKTNEAESSRTSNVNRIPFAHVGEVTSIYLQHPLLLSAGVDGVVHIWHTSYFNDGPIMTLHHKGRRVNSVLMSFLLILTAAEDGKLRLWDIAKKSLVREIAINSSGRPIISMACLELYDRSKIITNNESGIKIAEFPYDWIKLRNCYRKKKVIQPHQHLTKDLKNKKNQVSL